LSVVCDFATSYDPTNSYRRYNPIKWNKRRCEAVSRMDDHPRNEGGRTE
jgi:hypothetical protein